MLKKLIRTNRIVLVILIFIFPTCKKEDKYVYYDYYKIGNKTPTGSYKLYENGECYYYLYYRSDGKRHPFTIDDVIKPNTWSFDGHKQLVLNGDIRTIVSFRNDTLFVKNIAGELYGLIRSNNQR